VNRQYFEEQLRKHDDEKYLPLTVVFADLNGLKLTNDIYGHETGDLLLRKVAGILKKNSRKRDIIARTGGDEFIMLFPNTTADEAAEIIAIIGNDLSGERINAIKCSMSLGFDTRVSMQQDIEQIKKNAEIEMYREKTLMRKHKGTEMIQDIMNNLHERSAREKSHSETTSDLCVRMGRALHWNRANTRKLSEAGYYHDIGKIVLSDSLLRKIDLDLLEAHEKQQHVIAGYRILNLSDTTLDLAEIVYCHHENWDGSGYPKGLKGEEIPIQSRIIAVVEQYDFMTSSSNPNPCSREEALEKIRINAGVKFDPIIVEVFLKTMALQE
jgi:diguanylate cyclase (GGDEF)-like protein